MLVPVFANRKKSKENFCFYKKRQEAFVLQQNRDRGSRHPEQQEWRHQAPSLGTTLSISAASHGSLRAPALYFVHPLAS